VVMDATGVYWKAPWHVLDPEPTFELVLANAQHVKYLPGRKTDVADAHSLASLLECGLLRGSFVPDPLLSRLRDLTRHRKKLTEGAGPGDPAHPKTAGGQRNQARLGGL
jgi:transposase